MTRPAAPRSDARRGRGRSHTADEAPESRSAPTVRALLVARDDTAIVEGLRAGEGWARAALFDRYAPQVQRILARILGHELHTDLEDLVHDAFVQALGSIHRLRDPAALLGWMQSIAAHTAYRSIRARRARRWLRFWEPAQVPEVVVDGVEPELVEAYRRTYALLDRMPTDERVAFALRHIDGMELTSVADACACSLATIKRRLTRAEQRFARAAERDEILRGWLREGGRWTT